MKVRQPTVFTDGGPWAKHDQACAVYQDKAAVLDLNHGRYLPSWHAQREGWMLVKVPRYLRWLVRLVSKE